MNAQDAGEIGPGPKPAPKPDAYGEEGEYLVIEGHEWDVNEVALAMLKEFADFYSWSDAAEFIEHSWHQFTEGIERVYLTEHPSGEWASFHTNDGPGARPVYVWCVEDDRSVSKPEPEWPEWLTEREAPESVVSGGPDAGTTT